MTLILESPHFIEALTFVQLVGLCIGFGGAMFADMIGLRLLFSSRELQLDTAIQLIPRFMALGLTLLWASVLTMVYLRFDPDKVPHEIKAIMVLMGFLTFSVLITKFRLTRLTRMWGIPRVFSMSYSKLAMIVVLGCMPFAAWCFMLLIVNFTELQKFQFRELLTFAGAFWVACAVVFFTLISVTRAVIAGRAAMSGRTLVRPVAHRDANGGQRTRNPKGRAKRKSKIAPVRIPANDHGSLNQDWHESPGGHMGNGHMGNGHMGVDPRRGNPQPPQRAVPQQALQYRPESRPRGNAPRLNEATQRANANTRGAAIDYMDDYRDGRRAQPSRNGALLSAITQVPVQQQERRVERRSGQRWWEGV